MLSPNPRLRFITDGDVVLEEAVRGLHQDEYEARNGINLEEYPAFLKSRTSTLAYCILLGTKDLLGASAGSRVYDQFEKRNFLVTNARTVAVFDFDVAGPYTEEDIEQAKQVVESHGLPKEFLESRLEQANNNISAKLKIGDTEEYIRSMAATVRGVWEWAEKENPEHFEIDLTATKLERIRDYFMWFEQKIDEFKGD